MKQNLTENELIEVKGVIEILTDQVRQVLSLEPVRQQVEEAVRQSYSDGLERVDKELKPQVNVQMPSNVGRQMETLFDYTFQNVQNVGDEIGNSLRQEMQRGLLNGDNKAQLIKRIRATFKEKKFRDRFRMIIRTETLRANNTAALEAAHQVQDTSGIKLKKWLDVTMDDRTSDTCKEEHKLYPKEKAIPLNDDFVYKFQNKTFRAQNPPFHPNCRTIVRFTREGQREFSRVGDANI